MTPNADILVVEDEPAMRDLLSISLERAGFKHREAASAEEARVSILAAIPDLILIDWMLPGRSGLDLVRDLRQAESTRTTPIIMLTARTEEADRVEGIDVGADDYVTKPFSVKELVARIKAVLRRSSRSGPKANAQTVEASGLRVDAQSHRITVNDQPLGVSATEFHILYFLMTHANRIYTRSQIINAVWGPHAHVGDRTVDVHIRSLRKVLTATGHHDMVETVRGAGYRFSPRS